MESVVATVEVVSPVVEQLKAVAVREQLDLAVAQPIIAPFLGFVAQVEQWKKQAASIKITDATQTREMKLAREVRLSIKGVRVDAEKKRKALKEQSLREGKMIDGCYAIVDALATPIEEALLEQEQFIERAEAARREKLKGEREALLKPFGTDTSFYDLGGMSEEVFDDLLIGQKAAFEAREKSRKEAEEAKIRADREAAEKAEAMRKENERLRAEKAEADRKAAEAKAAADKVAKDAQMAAAKAKADADAKAKVEREAADARERLIRQEAEKKEAAERARREAAEAEVARHKKIEEEKRAAAAEAARRAAMAPDKDKILAMAASVRAIQVPALDSAEGIQVQVDVLDKIEELAAWIEQQAARF